MASLEHYAAELMDAECVLLGIYAEIIRTHGAIGAQLIGVDDEIAQILQGMTAQRIRLARRKLGPAPLLGIRRGWRLAAALQQAERADIEELVLPWRALAADMTA